MPLARFGVAFAQLHPLRFLQQVPRKATRAARHPILAEGQGFRRTLNPNPSEKDMTTFYAQPYDISATGFYLDTADQYQEKISSIKNVYGQPVEEFEIQFIDGETIDAQLAEALGINQATICRIIELIDEWSDDQKIRAIIAIGECGYSFDPVRFDPDDIDLDLYETGSLRDLAMQFVDDGLFGEIPERISIYPDFDMIARDLSCDYSMTRIDGTNYAYRCP